MVSRINYETPTHHRMNFEKYYTNVMTNIKFDKIYIKSDKWYKTLYGLLGIKYLKRIIKLLKNILLIKQGGIWQEWVFF